MQASLIKNAHIVSPGLDLPGGAVLIRDGRIETVIKSGEPLPATEATYDAQGKLLVPGFIDIHSHGAAGYDISDLRAESWSEIAKAKLKEGVTSFLPTTLTLRSDDLTRCFQQGREYFDNQAYAKTPGIHLEGPFINPNCAGAQNPKFVRPPDWMELKELTTLLPIKVVSLAAEMPKGIPFIESLREHDITPSLAHTAATYEQFKAARQAGAKHLTHFCNQMTPLHHREIGLVGAGLLDPEIMVEMICDLIHLCPDMIRLAFKVIGPQRIMLITDSMAASGLADDQTTQLGGLEVHVKEGVARLASGALAGSTLTMNRALQNVAEVIELPLSEIIQTTSWNQAQSLGLSGLGAIAPGNWADMVILDERFQPQAVFVNGENRLPA